MTLFSKVSAVGNCDSSMLFWSTVHPDSHEGAGPVTVAYLQNEPNIGPVLPRVLEPVLPPHLYGHRTRLLEIACLTNRTQIVHSQTWPQIIRSYLRLPCHKNEKYTKLRKLGEDSQTCAAA